MNPDSLNKLITDALAIEAEEAKEAGALGYMARVLVQATMPHSKIADAVFRRRNGALSLTILADPDIGLPYGSKPRLLLSWLTTEAVKTQSRNLILGDSLSAFMRELGMVPTGGRWGTITSLKDQTKRLFAASIKAIYDDGHRWALETVDVVETADLWWHPQQPEQIGIWHSNVSLTERFFLEVIDNPIPIDMRALKALSRSPLALDIYCWLTYRMSYLRNKTEIPWGALELQFGSSYADTRVFRFKFLGQLKKVLLVYGTEVEEGRRGLILKPSKPHIPFRSVDKSVT